MPSKQSENEKDPAVGDVVHVIATIGGPCLAAIICGTPAEGAVPENGFDLDPVYVTYWNEAGAPGGTKLVERSDDGHANTWHRPCEP